LKTQEKDKKVNTVGRRLNAGGSHSAKVIHRGNSAEKLGPEGEKRNPDRGQGTGEEKQGEKSANLNKGQPGYA